MLAQILTPGYSRLTWYFTYTLLLSGIYDRGAVSALRTRRRLLLVPNFSTLRGMVNPTHMYKQSAMYSMRRHMIANRTTLPYTGLHGELVSEAVEVSASA